MTKEYDSSLIYIPPKYEYSTSMEATLSVKFNDDIFLMKSFLDQWKIPYKEEDLEMSFCGLGLRIKKNKKDKE